MEHFVLTDAQWAKMALHCLGKPGDPGRSGTDNRLFVEAVLWIVRTGNRWRDLPARFGNSTSVYVRFRYWVKSDVFQKMFDAVAGDPDMEFAMVDGRIVDLRQKGQGRGPGHAARGGLRARPLGVQKPVAAYWR